MKTQNNSLSAAFIKSVLVAVILLAFVAARAQHNVSSHSFKPRTGLGITALATCNSFGKQYIPYASVFLGRKTEVAAGPMFNHTSLRFTGVHSRVMFYLINAEDSHTGNTSLYNFVSVQNHTNQSFSKKWIAVEEWTSRNSDYAEVDFNNIRFKGTQVSLGFGVKHHFTDHIGMAFNLAMTYYRNSRMNYQDVPLYYESQGFGLHMAVGVQYTLGTYTR